MPRVSYVCAGMIAVMFGASVCCCYFFELQAAAGSHHFAPEGFELPLEQDNMSADKNGPSVMDSGRTSEVDYATGEDSRRSSKRGSRRKLLGSGSDTEADLEPVTPRRPRKNDNGYITGDDDLELVPLSDGDVAPAPAKKQARNGAAAHDGSGSDDELHGNYDHKEERKQSSPRMMKRPPSLSLDSISDAEAQAGERGERTPAHGGSSGDGAGHGGEPATGSGPEEGPSRHSSGRWRTEGGTNPGTPRADGAAAHVVVVGGSGADHSNDASPDADGGGGGKRRRRKKRKKRKKQRGEARAKANTTRAADVTMPGGEAPAQPPAARDRLVHLEPLMQPPKPDASAQISRVHTEVVPVSDRILAGLGRAPEGAWVQPDVELERVAPGFWEASDRPSNLVQCVNSCICCLAVAALIVVLTASVSAPGGGVPDAVAPVVALASLMLVVASIGIIGACGYCCDLLPLAGEHVWLCSCVWLCVAVCACDTAYTCVLLHGLLLTPFVILTSHRAHVS